MAEVKGFSLYHEARRELAEIAGSDIDWLNLNLEDFFGVSLPLHLRELFTGFLGQGQNPLHAMFAYEEMRKFILEYNEKEVERLRGLIGVHLSLSAMREASVCQEDEQVLAVAKFYESIADFLLVYENRAKELSESALAEHFLEKEREDVRVEINTVWTQGVGEA